MGKHCKFHDEGELTWALHSSLTPSDFISPPTLDKLGFTHEGGANVLDIKDHNGHLALRGCPRDNLHFFDGDIIAPKNNCHLAREVLIHRALGHLNDNCMAHTSV